MASEEKETPEDLGSEEYESASSMLFDELAGAVFDASKKGDRKAFISALRECLDSRG